MKRFLGAAIALAVTASPAVADRYRDGETAYLLGQFERSYKLLMPLARKGDMRAQYLMGRQYQMGQGVRKDMIQAYIWYGRAAKQGHTEAGLFQHLLVGKWKMSPEQVARAKAILDGKAPSTVASVKPTVPTGSNPPTADRKPGGDDEDKKGSTAKKEEFGPLSPDPRGRTPNDEDDDKSGRGDGKDDTRRADRKAPGDDGGAPAKGPTATKPADKGADDKPAEGKDKPAARPPAAKVPPAKPKPAPRIVAKAPPPKAVTPPREPTDEEIMRREREADRRAEEEARRRQQAAERREMEARRRAEALRRDMEDDVIDDDDSDLTRVDPRHEPPVAENWAPPPPPRVAPYYNYRPYYRGYVPYYYPPARVYNPWAYRVPRGGWRAPNWRAYRWQQRRWRNYYRRRGW